MKLVRRLLFALHYDFEPLFIVYNFKDQLPYQCLTYEDALKVRDEQPMYRPKIMVEVRKKK